MAERIIRGANDPALFVQAKTVANISAGVIRLLDDLVETMRANSGVGLAASQVGIAKRIFVVEYEDKLYEMINPQIISEEGKVLDIEGCLSFPGLWGEVFRPEKIVVKAQNRQGEFYEVIAEGVLARAICHEYDHLDGRVFTDLVDHFLSAEELEELFGSEPTQKAVIEYTAGEKSVTSLNNGQTK